MAEFTKVAKTAEIPAGTGKTVEAGGRKIGLFNVGGRFEAVSDTCLHRGGPLGEGTLEGTVVTCPWHHWKYDVATGDCKMKPGAKVEKFAVKVEGDDVLVAA